MVDPLLEKLLIQFLIGRNYESAEEAHNHQVLTSFTNGIFDIVCWNGCLKDDEHYRHVIYVPDIKVDELVKHGLKTKSQITIAFNGESNCYTLVNVRDDSVKLYNLYVKTFIISKNIFLDSLENLFKTYFENKIFKIDKIKSLLKFKDTGSTKKERIST